MKKYTIEIVQNDKGVKPFVEMNRNNKGFTVFEMICFIGYIKDELIKQAYSMNENNTSINREYHNKGTKVL